MNQSEKLTAVKIVHTLIWLFFVAAIFYIMYSGISNNITIYTWIAIGLIIAEGVVLVLFKMFCPLTLIARKYSDSEKEPVAILSQLRENYITLRLQANNKHHK